MRRLHCSLALLAGMLLGACAPAIPDSGAPDTGAGVGFGNYQEYQAKKAARDAQLASGGVAVPPAGAISDGGEGSGNTSVASDTLAALDATDRADRDANSGVAVVHASPGNPTPGVSNGVGISNENDFGAVGEQRTIESDAARIQANRAQYQVIETQALPKRSGGQGPNIVAYALQSNHPVGTQVYRRVSVASASRFAKNCAKYASPDQAQEAFLGKGGPNRDRLGLDPDGDGYACSWNPAPFRKAVSG